MIDIKQLSTHLKISPTTLRKWAKKFDIPTYKEGNKLTFSFEVIEMMESIKEMRDKGSGFTTIRKLIHNHIPDDAQHYRRDIELILDSTIGQNKKDTQQLAEKYARATYTIRQLEAHIKDLETRLRQLPSLEQWHLAQCEKKELKENAKQLKESLSQLEEECDRLQHTLVEFQIKAWQKFKLWVKGDRQAISV